MPQQKHFSASYFFTIFLLKIREQNEANVLMLEKHILGMICNAQKLIKGLIKFKL
jgi:hypothetical protein